MKDYLYEKDLRVMKMNILESTRHDMAVRELAKMFGLHRQEMRKTLVNRCDMAYLENLPTRFEAYKTMKETIPETEQLLGTALLTTHLHILPNDEVAPFVGAVNNGKMLIEDAFEEIREVLLK